MTSLKKDALPTPDIPLGTSPPTPRATRKWRVPAVSRWFRFDWQYVLATGRLPAFKPVAVVLAAMPLLTDAAQVVPIGLTGFWLLWGASVSSLVAFSITRLRCPALIREYERFEDYEKVGHSHRWIGRLFFLNRDDYSDLDSVVRETVEKGIALPADAVLEPNEFAGCPLMPHQAADGVIVLAPVNARRDLFLGFWIDGRRYVMPIQEDDPKIKEKTRELFWLMFSNLVRSRETARTTVWLIYGLALLLSGSALVLNLAKPLDGVLPVFERFLIHESVR